MHATNLCVSLVDEWPRQLLEAMSLFHRERLEEGLPWEDRWLTAASSLSWKYRNHGAGNALGAIAYSEGEIVGSATLTLRSSRGVFYGELGDLAVAERCRGMGLFHRLVDTLLERAEALGVQVVFCCPNAAGAAALLKGGRFANTAHQNLNIISALRPAELIFLKRKLQSKIALKAANIIDSVFIFIQKFFLSLGGHLYYRKLNDDSEISALVQADFEPNITAFPSPASAITARLSDHPFQPFYSFYSDGQGSYFILRKCGIAGRIAFFIVHQSAKSLKDLDKQISQIKIEAIKSGAVVINAWSSVETEEFHTFRRRGFFKAQEKPVLFWENPRTRASAPDWYSTLRISLALTDKA